MNYDYKRHHNGQRRFFRDSSGSAFGPASRRFTPADLAGLFKDHPELRLEYDPAVVQIAQMLMADPEDADVQEMFGQILNKKQAEYMASGDVFWGNYPSPGSVAYPADFLSLGRMPTGDPIGILINQMTGNVGVLGPTKSGKTTLLALLLSHRQLLEHKRIIAFVKKPELRHLAAMLQITHLVLALRKNNLCLSLIQPPDGVPEDAWLNELPRLTGQAYGRFSSQRLFGDVVQDLMKYHPDGVYPTLRQIVEVIDAFKPRFGMREAAYKESILWVLKDLLNCTGAMWDHSSSDFLEKVVSSASLLIVELEDLPQEHFTFIVTYVMRWVYFKCLHEGRVSM